MGNVYKLSWFVAVVLTLLIGVFVHLALTTPAVHAEEANAKDSGNPEAGGSGDETQETTVELLPLDLTPPEESTDDADPLSGGVTATNNTPTNTAESSTPGQDPEKIDWSPDSGRFLLKDRQEQLSVNTDVDKTDNHVPAQESAAPVAKSIEPSKKTVPIPSKPEPKAEPAAGFLPELPDPEAGGSDNGLKLPDDDADPHIIPEDIGGTYSAGFEREQDQVTLAEYFEDSGELIEASATMTDETVVDHASDIKPGESATGREAAKVIRTEPGLGNGMGKPKVSELLSGRADDENLGSGLAGFTPWRSMGIMLALLAAMFAGVWLVRRVKNPMSGLRQKSMSVIETITLSPGRQIVIVEMHGEALVLGMTPQSINLLDKVPLDSFDDHYQKTVNMIIEREDKALPEDWRQHPQFGAAPVERRLAPPLGNTYGPSGKMKVSEMRRARAARGSFLNTPRTDKARPVMASRDENATKDALINRVKQQIQEIGK